MAEEQPAEQPAPAQQPAPQQPAPQQPAPQQQPAAQPAQQPQQQEQAQQPSGSKPMIPFILALVGGILMLVHGVVAFAMADVSAQFNSMIPGIESLMLFADMGSYAAILFGALIVVGALLLWMGKSPKIMAILVLVLSIAAVFTGGGFLVGTILGVIGGALGLKG